MGEGILIDTAGTDCCCAPPLLVCPDNEDVATDCGQTVSLSLSGLTYMTTFGGDDNTFCLRGITATIYQLDLPPFGAFWSVVPVDIGGCLSLGNASRTTLDQGGNVDCGSGSSGELCMNNTGCDPSICYTDTTGSNFGGTGSLGCAGGENPVIWIGTIALQGALSGGQFRYGAPLFPCPTGPWSYGPLSPDPSIMGFFPFSNPGIINPGTLTV